MEYQGRLMRELAERKGWEIVQTFEIPGESAYKWYPAERPQFQAAIAAAKRKQFDTLMVYDLSRFARNQAVLHETRRTLREVGCQLWVVAGDYDAVLDGVRAGMEGIIAEQSSTDHSRRVRAAYDNRHRRGLPTGDIPFGYRRGEGPDKPPVVVPGEAAAIRRAFHDYALGKGYQVIASEWRAAGLIPHSKRGIPVFSMSSVQSVIENRFYIGMVNHRGEEREGLHEPIVTASEWEAAAGRTKRHATRRAPSYTATLAGLVSCLHCAGPIWSHRIGDPCVHYYFEPAKRRGRKCAASGKSWRSTGPDGVIESMILGISRGDDWLKYASTLVNRRDDVVDNEAVRQSLEREKERATDAYVIGARPREWWLTTIARLDRELTALPVQQQDAIPAIGERLTIMADAWQSASQKQRNAMCGLLFEEIRLDILGKNVFVRPSEEFVPYFDARRQFSTAVDVITPDRTRTQSRLRYYAAPDLGIRRIA